MWVGAERPRRKTETVNGEELQVREFHGDSLSEIGALAADEAVKLQSVMKEPTCRNKRLQTENGFRDFRRLCWTPVRDPSAPGWCGVPRRRVFHPIPAGRLLALRPSRGAPNVWQMTVDVPRTLP